MEKRICRAALALALLFCSLVVSSGAVTEASLRPSAGELIIGSLDTCFPMDYPVAGTLSQDVLEGDEIVLQRALSIVHGNRDQFVAVLFYASWCPFSRICIPNFSKMASLFPTIPHFAFEESVVRPSILSRYGVHGFPTLFLLNSSMRVRYQGPRSINYLTSFYSDVTGVKPVPVDPTTLNKSISFANPAEDIGGAMQENCPFSWARSPENLLQQDTYLALASSFVLLRLLYYFLPKLSAHAKRAWGWHIELPSLMGLCDYSQAFFQQARQGLSRLNPGKRANLQEGAMTAKAWASKSLASVSIGEPSSGKF